MQAIEFLIRQELRAICEKGSDPLEASRFCFFVASPERVRPLFGHGLRN